MTGFIAQNQDAFDFRKWIICATIGIDITTFICTYTIENFVNRNINNLLIIEDSENSRKAHKIHIGNVDVKFY